MRVFDSTLLIAGTQAVVLFTAFVVSVLVSRVLGAEGKGVFSLLLSIATILFGICNLGLGFASQYFVSRKPEAARGHFSNILIFPMIAAGLVTGALLASYSVWQPYIKGLSLGDAIPPLVMLPFMLLYDPCCQLLVVAGRLGWRSLAVLTQSGTTLLAAIMLLAAGVSAVGVSYCYAVGWLLGGAVAISLVIRYVGPPARPSVPLLRETLHYSSWIYLANLIKAVFLRIDFLFVYAMRSSGEAGVYSVAVALTSGMTVLMQAVETILYPRTSAKSDDDARLTTPFYYRQMMLVMGVSGMVMAILTYPLLSIFGSVFVSGTLPMLVLIIAIGIKGLNTIFYLHILGRGKSFVMTLAAAVVLALATLLNWILVPVLGMTGAACATLGASLGENLLLTMMYRRLTDGSIRALYAFSRTDTRVLVGEATSLLARLRGQVTEK